MGDTAIDAALAPTVRRQLARAALDREQVREGFSPLSRPASAPPSARDRDRR